MKNWIYHAPQNDAAGTLESSLKLHAAIAEILVKRGFDTPPAAERHLDPRLAHLEDPLLIANVGNVAERLARAVAGGERIAIMGDYDVDGVTSTTLLVSILRALGGDPLYYVPRRLEEGYGMSREAVERALRDGPFSLFVALDCGTNSTAEIATLTAAGTDVIVIDHHRSKERAGDGFLLVNPHVNDVGGTGEPWSTFCTVGLVFKVCHALLKLLRTRGDGRAAGIVLRDYLDLVAMGTIADLVPLTGENRLLTMHGLRQLQKTARPGLRALMRVGGIVPGARLQPSDISFRLGPRINASGRLADAMLPVRMLLCDDEEACAADASSLNAMNRERQEIERRVCAEATEQLTAIAGAHPNALVAHGDWHPGVVGIVAGKLCRQFNRPCIVLGREGDWGKGSGRSVAGVNLVEALAPAAEILESWGGHPMAVGVTVKAANVPELRRRFDDAVRLMREGGAADGDETLEIVSWLDTTHITDEFLDQLERLHPFGEGNPEPIFGIADVSLRTPPVLFGDANYRFQVPLDSWRRLGVVAWRKADNLPPSDTPLDLAVKLCWNYYNGRRYPQAELLEWRPAEGAG
ncbi:MAG: single-stranded-DNA-specific exonuclease RecJ [Puniceicoccales bacterium]|jgi:single-stranded-DNA-specific exonuclease|nr:single-stranded-DNA-specific exonuclease RecJ [Puniceicoccales bacterium]